METKKTEPQIEVFATEVESLSEKLLSKNDGFIMLAYTEDEAKMENSFLLRGKITALAESLFNGMVNNQAFATAVIVAANAYSHKKMAEAQLEAAVQNAEAAPKETKKRRTKKVS